ncbi:hypothetical protein Hdeb2414_s0474g00901421 [Helianthus debilis subsp. tardiflorus]
MLIPPKLARGRRFQDLGIGGCDMIIAMTQEAINYLQEEAQSSTSRIRQPLLERDRLGAHERLVHDYFCENPLYDDGQFRRRFRMSRRLFVKISSDLAEASSLFFTQRESASHKVGFSGIQKCTTAIRQLAYGTASDAWDEYLRMSARMCRDSLEISVKVLYLCTGDATCGCQPPPTFHFYTRPISAYTVFLGCWGVLIARTGIGRHVQPLGKGNIIVVTTMVPP